MTCKSLFVFSDALLNYHFHADHPFNQKRVLLAKELLESSHTLDKSDIIEPRLASEEDLELFHDRAYIETVKKAGIGKLTEAEGMEYGLGTEDTPMFTGMHEASSYLVGGTLTAVDAVLEGKANHALHLGGGLHHGFKRKASGCCIYNDGAVAIKYIRERYNLRVLYVDTGGHHGDGAQGALDEDPNACASPPHRPDGAPVPRTGTVDERRIRQGHGYALNSPIQAVTQAHSASQRREAGRQALAECFGPDVIVTQA